MDDCRHGQQKRTCEICELEAERDRLATRLSRLSRAYTELNIARHGLKEALDSVQRQAQDSDRQRRNVGAERDRLRAVVDALREWQKARQRLQIADTADDEDRATDALDVIGQDVLAKLAALDERAEATGG